MQEDLTVAIQLCSEIRPDPYNLVVASLLNTPLGMRLRVASSRTIARSAPRLALGPSDQEPPLVANRSLVLTKRYRTVHGNPRKAAKCDCGPDVLQAIEQPLVEYVA